MGAISIMGFPPGKTWHYFVFDWFSSNKIKHTKTSLNLIS